MPRHFTVEVDIETDDLQSAKEGGDRLLRWLETYGHTSVSHGFSFISIGETVTKSPSGKPVKETP